MTKSSKRIIDLTFPIHEGMSTFPVPWHPIVEMSIMGRHGIEGRETRKVIVGTHTGTHVDAPRHFLSGARTVDDLPLEILIGEALVVDFSFAQRFQEITVDDFKRYLVKKIPKRLLLRFDWSDHWGKLSYYTDHPFISEEAAYWLVESGIKLIALDTPTPDSPKNGRGSLKDSPVHKILLEGGIVIVEYITNLKALRKREVELIVLPLKILDGDGAPARCVAVEA